MRQRTVRHNSATTQWLLPLTRLCLLLTIVLLPVEMRAGAAESHPHSLLQLLIDASDGPIDHHHHAAPTAHGHEHTTDPDQSIECVADPDVPAVEETGRAGGAPMLAALVLLLIVPAPTAGPGWPVLGARGGRLPLVEPPPPRSGRN